MPDSFMDRLKSAWNVFRFGESTTRFRDIGPSYSYSPSRTRMMLGTEQSIIASIYTRIGIDVAAIPIQHVRLDSDGRFAEVIDSGLNRCLTLQANIDQTGRAFVQDAVQSMCDEGVVALVPVDTTLNPTISGSYDIMTMRTGKIIDWFPEHVRVNVYNSKKGFKEDITVPKKITAIVENPLYSVMNETNSTLKRLIAKLNLLDAIDIQSGSGKLDLLIQLPYVIKTDKRREQAEARRALIESQLQDSKYGVAYVDGTEKVIQLNRPAENNLMGQIEYLTSMLYSQLGMTPEVFNGTADEKTMINYYNRTVEPILSAITDSMKSKFLTKTGRSQGQTIMAIRDPFRLVPVNEIADIADKLTRNEVLTGNELRGIIGYKPSKDPTADELRNKNLNEASPKDASQSSEELTIKNQNGRSK